MSQSLYESLFESGSGPDAATDVVRAFAAAARIHRAAYALATDEMMEGVWVEEEAETIEQMRFAADDRSTTEAVYMGQGYSVQIQWQPGGVWMATQTAGPAGASLRFGSDWVVLTIGKAAKVPVSGFPDEILLVDLQGREITLQR